MLDEGMLVFPRYQRQCSSVNPSNKLVVDCYADADLWDCGDMKILKTLFVLEIELDSW